jgi:hypothetical protein
MEIEYKNKIINSKCGCKKGLNWTNTELVMIEPCEHIVHLNCISDEKCNICNENMECFMTELELKNLSTVNKIYYQKYIDLISMRNINNLSNINISSIVNNFPNLLGVAISLPVTRGFEEGYELCRNMLCTSNAIIKIKGKKNIYKGNKIIIANHTTYFDFILIYFIFRCGFLSSSMINDSIIGNFLKKIIPVLVIERGNCKNTVEEIKEYVDKYGSLCLFPEGIMTHPDTIVRFRTGAFYAEQPISPIVIRYEPVIADSSISCFIQKLISNEKLKVYIDILPIQFPPFNDLKIEEIRYDMAKVGNFALSRVSNRDIDDKKN